MHRRYAKVLSIILRTLNDRPVHFDTITHPAANVKAPPRSSLTVGHVLEHGGDKHQRALPVWKSSHQAREPYLAAKALEGSSWRSSSRTRAATATAASTASSGGVASRSTRNVLNVMRTPGTQAKGATRKHLQGEGDRDRRSARQPHQTHVRDGCVQSPLGVRHPAPPGAGSTWQSSSTHGNCRVVDWAVDGRAHRREARSERTQAGGRQGRSHADSTPMLHEDQGAQYTSRAFQHCLESHGIAQSMSRSGNPWATRSPNPSSRPRNGS